MLLIAGNPAVRDYNESDLYNCSQVSSQVRHKALWDGSGKDSIQRASLAATMCKGLSVSMSQQTNKQTRIKSFDFLNHWKCVHWPFKAARLRQLAAEVYLTSVLFKKRLWCVVIVLLLMMMMMMRTVTVLKPAPAFSDQTFSFLHSYHLSLSLSLSVCPASFQV